jgi:hypothetical protein
MGPPSYMRSVVDWNVVMRRIPVPMFQWILQPQSWGLEVTFFLKTEAAGSSETSILTHHDICCHNVELHNPYIHRCESTHFYSNRIHQAGRPASLPYTCSIKVVTKHIYPKISTLSLFVLIELHPSQKNHFKQWSRWGQIRPSIAGTTWCKTNRILSLVVGSFGLVSLPLTECSVLRDLGVTSLTTIRGPPIT